MYYTTMYDYNDSSTNCQNISQYHKVTLVYISLSIFLINLKAHSAVNLIYLIFRPCTGIFGSLSELGFYRGKQSLDNIGFTCSLNINIFILLLQLIMVT